MRGALRRACLTMALTVASIVAGGGGGSVSAASINVSLTYVVTSVDAGVTALAVGDRFTVGLTINDAVTDINASVGAGTFPGLLTAFSMTRDPGNVGTWTPGGTFDLPASNFVTGALGDNMAFQTHATGFPDGGAGLTFWDISLGFSWPFDLTDSGTGDTFAAQVGTPFGVPPATLLTAAVRFNSGAKEATMALVAGVPTMGPRPLLRLGVALALFAAIRLRSTAPTRDLPQN